MDIVLMVVTGISLALAAGMGVLLARMVRVERLRSDARVQLLEELAVGGASVQTEVAPLHEAPVPSFLQSTKTVAAPRSEPAAKTRRTVVDLPLRDEPTAHVEVDGVHELFQDEHEPSPWPRRFAVIGSLAAVLTLAVLGWNQVRESSGTSDTQSAAAAELPLELLSLRHAREGNTLTVTGLVQNPKGAAALSNVQATLFVFGPGGTFITSGRAPLDFTSLTAGDESPFVIRVPVSSDVARYRVGFRGPDDRVVAHVDRRADQLGRSF
jgi:hypothetical protein